MENLKLWEDLKNWKKNCDFVELSHEFSPDTPHWSGFPAMNAEMIFDYPDVFRVHIVQVATQYGTHVDAPAHFVPGKRMLNELRADEMVLPLCVIDLSAKSAKNCDYIFSRRSAPVGGDPRRNPIRQLRRRAHRLEQARRPGQHG